MSNGEAQRPFCSEIARENDEPLGATASRIDHWLLVEYRGLWSHDALAGSGLSDQIKARLRELVAARPRTRLLFIRRPDRRHHEGVATYVADSRAGHERLAGLELEEHEELRRIDPFEAAETLDEPLFLVCTHGKHDRCCARYGRPLWEGSASSWTSPPRGSAPTSAATGSPGTSSRSRTASTTGGSIATMSGTSSTTTSPASSHSTGTGAAPAGPSTSRRRSGACGPRKV